MFSAGEEGSPNPFHIDEFYYEDLLKMCLEVFSKVMIFENTMMPDTPLGKDMRAKRIQTGRHGVLHSSSGAVSFGPFTWPLARLENTHSFMVAAAEPRP